MAFSNELCMPRLRRQNNPMEIGGCRIDAMALKRDFTDSHGCQFLKFLKLGYLNYADSFMGEENPCVDVPTFCCTTEGKELGKVLIRTNENAQLLLHFLISLKGQSPGPIYQPYFLYEETVQTASRSPLLE